MSGRSSIIQVLKSIGVPERYRYVKEIPTPKIIHAGKGKYIKRINEQEQLKWLKLLKSKSLNYSYVLGISSYPTDTKAMEVTINLLNKEYTNDRSFRVSFLNVGHVKNFSNIFDLDNPPSLVVLYNIMEESTTGRLQMTRDLITKFEGSFIITVIATKNIAAFFRYKLQHPVDCILNF